MNDQLKNEILRRLATGQPLDGLGLGTRNGRIDLSNLRVPAPTTERTIRMDIADVAYLDALIKIRNVSWRSLDFTESELPHFLFFNSTIHDCVFDGCYCREWGLWGTQVATSSFRSADLGTAVLGGVEDGRRNSFHQVDFSRANLRGSVYTSAQFIGCKLNNAKLHKVDFRWSTFADCTFEGELNEVCFNRKSYDAKEAALFPPNEMRNVDFSHAKLRWTEFRGLDLDTVRFPEDDEHIVVNDYRQVLDRIVDVAMSRPDAGSRRLAAMIGGLRKWAGLNQRRGVLNKRDIVEAGGEEALHLVFRVLNCPS